MQNSIHPAFDVEADETFYAQAAEELESGRNYENYDDFDIGVNSDKHAQWNAKAKENIKAMPTLTPGAIKFSTLKKISYEAAYKATEDLHVDFVFHGFPTKVCGILCSPGGTGKTYFALEMAAAIACAVAGGDIVGICAGKNKGGKVCYVAGEDPDEILFNRIRAISKHLSIEANASIAENIEIFPIAGVHFDAMENEIEMTSYFKGFRLVILDTLSMIHNMDENKNGDMKKLLALLGRVAANTGCSILLLHHVSKGSTKEGDPDSQQSARGASSIVDNARWCGHLTKMSKKDSIHFLEVKIDANGNKTEELVGPDRNGYFVKYIVPKQNYNALTPDLWLKRVEGGVLVPVTLIDKRIPGSKQTAPVADTSEPKAVSEPSAEPYRLEDPLGDPIDVAPKVGSRKFLTEEEIAKRLGI
ncbi:hypothetical protein AAKU67_004317 [Oxalobacteraceae bacterium GrIS 2.11]